MYTNDLTNTHKTAFVYFSTLWVICVLSLKKETIQDKAKTLLLLANANTFLLAVFISHKLQ